MPATHTWTFPLPRTHTGILLGNATFGAMLWGEDSTLRLTLGRADYWDHRGGLAWTEAQNYQAIRDSLETGDETRLRQLFEQPDIPAGEPRRPTVLPVGRFDLDFGPKARLLDATLDMRQGAVTVRLLQGGLEQSLRLDLAMDQPLLMLACPPSLRPPTVKPVPAWEYVGDDLAAVSFEPPTALAEKDILGWIQPTPVDGVCLAASRAADNLLSLTAILEENAATARGAADKLLGATTLVQLREFNADWWQRYWARVPRLELPNEKLQFLYDYGCYKLAGLTQPGGTAATLQGPWIEEYQLPPWSSDYHFNINVQMCYWPLFHGNCLDHLLPLFELIESWKPTLRHNAKVFLGIDDGLMLPHAVDDRCVCMGGFWTGSVDHGCTAWVAQMMYRYYRYTLDEAFLRERAYPFMVGAMRVYQAMLEREGDGFVLPVSVSPEYRGSAMHAWGRNASFQLACIHRLLEDLLEAAGVLGETPDPEWREIQAGLPRYTTFERDDKAEIALWEGTPLEESHRHHSHLAGLSPFDVLDWDDEDTMATIKQSIVRWIHQGPGLWSGWCVPWASIIHSRLGNAQAAELWLEIWQKLYTNQGHGTLHDVDWAGFSLMGKGATNADGGRPLEIMQIEAGMAAVAAIQEMLLHVRRGVNFLFRGAPPAWQRVTFAGMRTDGGFLVDAERVGGRVREVRVRAGAAGVFRLANPWNGDARAYRDGNEEPLLGGPILRVVLEAGDEVVLLAR